MQNNFYRDSYRAMLSLIIYLKDRKDTPKDIVEKVEYTWDKLGKIEDKYSVEQILKDKAELLSNSQVVEGSIIVRINTDIIIDKNTTHDQIVQGFKNKALKLIYGPLEVVSVYTY